MAQSRMHGVQSLLYHTLSLSQCLRTGETLGITGFLDLSFVRYSKELNVSKTGSAGKGVGDTCSVRLPDDGRS
jgi:hypothetical protein